MIQNKQKAIENNIVVPQVEQVPKVQKKEAERDVIRTYNKISYKLT